MDDQTAPPETRIRLLAQNFPSLWNAHGIRPWNALTFNLWAAEGGLSHGELCTARFLLSVWDTDGNWSAGKFCIMEALRVWDQTHRTAFLEWAADPWWA